MSRVPIPKRGQLGPKPPKSTPPRTSRPPNSLPLEKGQSQTEKQGRRGPAGTTQKPQQEEQARMPPPPIRKAQSSRPPESRHQESPAPTLKPSDGWEHDEPQQGKIKRVRTKPKSGRLTPSSPSPSNQSGAAAGLPERT
nr:acidic proline-rich protein PRP25-like [Procambarus clarkii]